MGLLDDAIREHLDLKRRHGAAEEEVARQEQEALGPPRRGEVPEPLQPARPDGEAEPEAEVDTPGPATDEQPPAAYAASAVPEAEPREGDWLEDPREAEAEAEPPAGEDVLEETPEFLQETPEHDRLWFEQKPPKDFDFDK